MAIFTWTAKSEKETEQLGEAFAKDLKAGSFLALYGCLGSGKTAFVRGVCRGLGCRIEAHSPSFALVNIYPGIIEVAHIDLYRHSGDLEELGWYELQDSTRVVIVEWAEKAADYLPAIRYDIFFEIFGPKTRDIIVVETNESRD